MVVGVRSSLLTGADFLSGHTMMKHLSPRDEDGKLDFPGTESPYLTALKARALCRAGAEQ